MKNILFVISFGMIMMLSVLSCKDSSSIQRAVDQYRTGEISIDSFMVFYADTINKINVQAWAERHKSDDDLAGFIIARKNKQSNLEVNYLFSLSKNGDVFGVLGLGVRYFKSVESGNKQFTDSAYFWLNKAGELGSAYAYIYLGLLDKLITNKSFTAKTVEYWRKGAKLGNQLCIILFAKAYYYGWEVEKDKSVAFKTLNDADFEKLEPEGLYLLAKMYMDGEGTQQNFYKAFEYFQYAANKGYTDAMCYLGNCYRNGTGVEKNDSLAFIQFNKAANAGNAWGQRCVAISYKCGDGTAANLGVANRWYSIAAKNGDEIAIEYCKGHNIDY